MGLTINGEPDKRKHESFDEADRKNPDFIFHIPGRMDEASNFAVMEVKVKNDREGIEKDFETLEIFLSKYCYQLGVFLYAGELQDSDIDYLISRAESSPRRSQLAIIYRGINLVSKTKILFPES